MLIDHLIYAALDLATAVADVERRFGIREQSGGKHLGPGTHNALLALGPRTYLEIIAPDPGQPRPSAPHPYGCATHARLAGWAIACDDVDASAAAARRRGYNPGKAIDGQRTGPTGTVLRWRATPLALVDDLVPFLICWGATEHPAATSPSGLILDCLQMEHPDRSSLAPLLTALDANVQIKPATPPALVAYLRGPNGSKVLR